VPGPEAKEILLGIQQLTPPSALRHSDGTLFPYSRRFTRGSGLPDFLLVFGLVVINIEAGLDERFGDLRGEYRDRKMRSDSNLPAQIRLPSLAVFGRESNEEIRNFDSA
jgi:hypothetical protein